MSSYILILTGFGILVLMTAWLPMVLKEAPLSLPISCVALGAALTFMPGMGLADVDPKAHPGVTERVMEFIVILSLTGAGLKLDRVLGWQTWRVTWRLMVIGMPLAILFLALAAHSLLGFGLAGALFLAALLAPTDPVLASDVQVGPPRSGYEDETRFALTSEAGLNDSFAFPFVLAAIAILQTAGTGEGWFLNWVSYAVIWKIGIGVAGGWLVGRGLGWVLFHMPNRSRISRTGDGFVALGITAISYGVVEMLSGYGFLAVFVSALALRSSKPDHAYHKKLHDFAEEMERVMMMVLLVLFGASIANGHLIQNVTWQVVAFALVTLFVIRPVTAWVSMSGLGLPRDERAVISFFGIRGLGSLYYLAYGLSHAQFPAAETLWTVTSLTIVISIFLHGATVTPTMQLLDLRHGVVSQQQELPLEETVLEKAAGVRL
jgi:NhaP-type Na+/H+ or K+/H+ antiporter